MQNEVESIAEAIYGSPFVYHEQYHDDFNNNLYCLKKEITELSKNPLHSKYKLLKAMFIFSNMYEQFRPDQITKNDPYFGTVKKDTDYLFLLIEVY